MLFSQNYGSQLGKCHNIHTALNKPEREDKYLNSNMTAGGNWQFLKASRIVGKHQGVEFNCIRKYLQRFSPQLFRPRPILAPGAGAYPWPPLLPNSSGKATYRTAETGRRNWVCGWVSSGFSFSFCICLSTTCLFWAAPATRQGQRLREAQPHIVQQDRWLSDLGMNKQPPSATGWKPTSPIHFSVITDRLTSNLQPPESSVSSELKKGRVVLLSRPLNPNNEFIMWIELF